MSSTELDVALFQSITGLINEQRVATRTERRECERFPFPCVQLVADYDGTEMPDQQHFRQVLCHDLSPGGFSFYSFEVPETSHLIVTLGKVPHFKFFVAEVVRVSEANTEHGHEYQIGCRFLRRLGSE
jgi:hypothetical protein